MILALTPLKLGFYSFRRACSPETRVMSLIRSPVVTSRSLFQTVGYQVTCMHITVSLITFIELLSIHCKHNTHKSTVLVRFCFAERYNLFLARNGRAGRNKEAERESAVFFFLLISICAVLIIWRSGTGYNITLQNQAWPWPWRVDWVELNRY